MQLNENAAQPERQAHERYLSEPFNTVHIYLVLDGADAGPATRAWFEYGWPALGHELYDWFRSPVERERLRKTMQAGAVARLEIEKEPFEPDESHEDKPSWPPPLEYTEDLDRSQWSAFLHTAQTAAITHFEARQGVRERDGSIHGGNSNEVICGIDLDSERYPAGGVALGAMARWEFLLTPELQNATLGFLWNFVNANDLAYGEIAHSVTSLGQTAMDYALGRHVTDPSRLLQTARKYLRGYGWITIVPQELAQRIGPAGKLNDTGAFHEVRELRAGGLWLQATPQFTGYDQAAAHRIARVLAPVLPAGLPHPTLGKQALIAEIDAREVHSNAEQS